MAKNKLSRNLKRYENMVLDEIKRIVRETAELLQKRAKERVPIDTGDLRDSINVTIAPDGLSAEVMVGNFYGVYIEFGTGIFAKNGDGRKTPWTYYNERYRQFVTTRGMKPNPFWHPSVEEAAKFFHSEIQKLGK